MNFIEALLVLFTCYLIAGRCNVEANLNVKTVDRSIDLRTQVTKITTKLLIENNGKSAVNGFIYSIEPEQKDHISFIAAHLREHGKPELRVSKVNGAEFSKLASDALFYSITLKDPLQPERSVSLEVELVFTNRLIPYPKEIVQKEKQLVKYTGNLYLFSPYSVIKQTTTLLLPSRRVESYTKLKPVTQSDSNITYGPHDKKSPFENEELIVHFENNNRFLGVTRLERAIEVSHWGNVAIEEKIELLHTGALLKGSFSRYEYTRESKSGQPSIQSFETVLPASASDIYYRDEIGNISTSHTRVKKDAVELNLRPRFPLFGGWKTKYTIGYNVPSYEYLYHDGDQYLLEMRAIDHIFDDMVIDEVILKVILPEGSYNTQLEMPFESTRLPDSLHYTYLDTSGRPVISIAKKNLVESHIQNFKLKYVFPRILMFREPLLVVAALYFMFLLVIIYVRLDFSIDKNEASESRLRISGQCEKILSAQDRRVQSYNDYDDHLNTLKTNKDVQSFLSVIKSVNQEYKSATTSITELAQKLKGESGDVFERVQDLQKYDRSLKELYNQQQSLYVDKLVPGKIGRQQFIEAESTITKKKEECVERINSIVKSLQ